MTEWLKRKWLSFALWVNLWWRFLQEIGSALWAMVRYFFSSEWRKQRAGNHAARMVRGETPRRRLS